MISPNTVKLRYSRRWEREHPWVCDSLLLVSCLVMSFHVQRHVSDYEYSAGPPDRPNFGKCEGLKGKCNVMKFDECPFLLIILLGKLSIK